MIRNPETFDAVTEAARLWAVRVADPSFDDWDNFTAWLDANPEHLAAYDAAVEVEAWAVDLFQAPCEAGPLPQETVPNVVPLNIARQSANDGGPSNPARRRWMGQGAIAASVAALAVTGAWMTFGDNGPTTYSTAPGERRVIELADGSSVTMNGNTLLTVASRRGREVTMDHGEALFDVVHDDRRPFIVHSGNTRLVDLGTIFNVVTDSRTLDVAVAEGIVQYEADNDSYRLEAGDALYRADLTAKPEIRRAAIASIGTWRTGYLQYDGATLATVAEDLARNIGRPVQVSDALASHRFTGTIQLDGGPEAVISRAAALAGLRYVANEAGWTMMSRDGSTR